jgi:hypothetical protein
MYGIAGLFKLTGRPTAEDAVAVFRMMEAEIHRGPDDWGLLIPESIGGDPRVQAVVGAGGGEHVGVYPGPASAPGAVLATRRLSILDLLPRGRMPMGSRDWDRPKMGFTFPFDPWMRARADELRALALDQKLLRPRAVEPVWDAFRARIHAPAPCQR